MGRSVLLCAAVLGLLLGAVSPVPLTYSATFMEQLEKEIKTSFDTGEISTVLEDVFTDLSVPDVFMWGAEKAWNSEEYPEKNAAFCTACRIAGDQILNLIESGVSLDVLFNMTIDICITANISSPNVCQSMIEVAKPQVSWILLNTPTLTGKDFCGTIFIGFDCQSDNPDRVWQVQMPDVPKPVLTTPTIPEGGPTLKVLHLADTHFDTEYLPGGNANCEDRQYCCREESGPVVNPNDAAGYWGDYRYCDVPRWTLESLYTHILEVHQDISFIVWTGDLLPHNVWNTSVEGNLYVIREAVAMVQQYFPNIPVFPALGNHEAHPVNAYPQPYIDGEFDISWLYDEIAVLWQNWLPADVAESIMYSGYYTAEVFPDLRLLSVNTNYCYNYNWWLLYDSVDPGQILNWMAAELQRAEDDGVYMYIISHIPSGGDCGYTWSHEYNKLIARYEGVIAGIFYGHTHKDHVQMFFDPEEPDRAMEVAFVGQSQTTYHALNPGYKIYTVDGGRADSTYTVLDHENWIFDLDAANAGNGPTFEMLYTAKAEYGMTDLSPQSYVDLIYEMAVNGSAKFDLFYKNYYKAGRPYMESGYDDKDKYHILCRLLVSDTSQRDICKKLPMHL